VPFEGVFPVVRRVLMGRGKNGRMAATLLHFVATWAEPICAPHRAEVAEAARRLGASVIECDVGSDPDLAKAYGVLNVPAVAVDGNPETLIVGAVQADAIVDRLRPST
jgi:hypothetical protein